MKRLEKGDGANGSTGQAMMFSPEQRRAVLLVASAPARYISIQGDAGSGKTTVVGAIRGAAQAQGYVVKGMAVTGNATLALAKASGIESMTVARFILEERARVKLVRVFDRIDQGVHPRAKELWIVDEASMLGQSDFGRLVHYAESAGARVVFVGDRRQLRAVPAGKPWEIVQDQGTPQAELKDNIRQRDPGERAAVDQVKRKDNAGALRTLAELGKVVVNASPVELIARLAKEWQGHANAGERPAIGVVTHRARLAVNQAIRGERKRAGEIAGKEVNATILESLQWTRAQIRSVVSYADAGQTLRVRFRRNYRSIGVTQGEYGEVVSVDEAKGRIALNIEGRSVSWQPMRNAEVEVYRTAERPIARGDWIITTREHSELGNASQWEVTTQKSA